MGYKAVRLQCGVPGIPDAYGVARGKLHYEPAEKGKALETRFSAETLPGRRARAVRARARASWAPTCTCCTTSTTG